MRGRRVLFATDLLPDDDAALAEATRLAADRRADLLILHVVPFQLADGMRLLHQAVDSASRSSADALRQRIPPDPSVPFRHLLEAGDPDQRILEVALREEVELLVLLARPRTGLARYLRASRIDRIAQAAPCPVITVRPGAGAPSEAAPRAHRAPSEALDTLRATLRARVAALDLTLGLWRTVADSMASRTDVRSKVAALLQAPPPATDDLLALTLGQQVQSMGAIGFQVLCPDGAVLLAEGLGPRPSPKLEAFLQRVRQHGPSVSPPLATGHAYGSGLPTCVVLAAAPIRVPRGPAPLLVLALDARRDFLRILAEPCPLESAETYAFDAWGVMLSHSRFPRHLRAVGLLPQDGPAQTPLVLRVCDPGGNLLAGYRSHPPFDRCPLTRMAAQATQGVSGFDTQGYRDYRGVEVLGTWEWLEPYGFGVAAEVDREAL